jgi:hypothetical protein
MDLDVNNYNSDELLVILNVDEEKDTLTFDKLQKILFGKIENINQTSEDLPDTKDNIISFYTKCFFKIVNNYQLHREKWEEIEEGKNEEFISVRERLLPALHGSHVVQQNNSMIAEHENHKSISTWNSHLKAGHINPLERKSYKKILNINTRFRENYQRTKSTDFTFTFPYPAKKVVSIKLGCTEFPKTVYTFSSNLGSNNFRISNLIGDPFSIIDISNGSYSPMDLTEIINTSINSFDVSLCYNINTGKMTFINKTDSSFNLNFDYDNRTKCPPSLPNIDKNQLTLGWMLGFRDGAILKPTYPAGQYERVGDMCCPILDERDISNVYTGKTSYTGEAVFDGHGTRYFLLSINDFQNNHNETFISPFKEQSLADNNILAKISTDCCTDCCSENPERIYFGPVDLTKLNIKLFDEFGRLVDINNADYSFTVELELLYDL